MRSRLLGIVLAASFPAFGSNRAPVTLHTGIEYTRVDGAPLLLDAAIPHGPGPFPAVIIVHGGAWVRGDRTIDVHPLFEPLSNAGFAWFSISYRLMTNVAQFGAAIEDVAAAIRFVKTHAAEYRIDPARIALIGESAGGQLAAMAALDPAPALKVRAVVAFYTPTDLPALAKNSDYVPQWVRDSLRGPFAPFIFARLAQLSPAEHISAAMPPFLLIHGTADPLVPFSQSSSMCSRMQSAGAACELYPVEGAGHGMRWWESSPGLAQAYKREMIRWLRAQLAG